MNKFLLFVSILVCFLFPATRVYAYFYPSIGSDVSFTDQNNIFYTLYASLGYSLQQSTFMGIGYTHEWDFTQTTSTQEFHIINTNLSHRMNKHLSLGGLVNYTFGATPNTDGYYSISLRIAPRYTINSIFSVEAGPLYYYVSGPGSFIGIFGGLYAYPDYHWFFSIKGIVDTSIEPYTSQQDTSIEFNATYSFNTYFSVYGIYRLSTGITTYPVNNFSGNGNGLAKGGIGAMSMQAPNSGMTDHSNNTHTPSINYITTTISTLTLGFYVTF
ncbi:MAG: hypothetical protein ACP5JP_02470 [bacterium]